MSQDLLASRRFAANQTTDTARTTTKYSIEVAAP
jgi:hypothetical protein